MTGAITRVEIGPGVYVVRGVGRGAQMARSAFRGSHYVPKGQRSRGVWGPCVLLPDDASATRQVWRMVMDGDLVADQETARVLAEREQADAHIQVHGPPVRVTLDQFIRDNQVTGT